MSGCPGYRDHDYGEDGFCVRCCNYNEDYDEGFDDDEDNQMVATTIDRRVVFLDKKLIDRAKELLREHKIASINEAHKVAELLEVEMGREPFDRVVSDIMIVALRETEGERKPKRVCAIPDCGCDGTPHL